MAVYNSLYPVLAEALIIWTGQNLFPNPCMHLVSFIQALVAACGVLNSPTSSRGMTLTHTRIIRLNKTALTPSITWILLVGPCSVPRLGPQVQYYGSVPKTVIKNLFCGCENVEIKKKLLPGTGFFLTVHKGGSY